MASSPAAPNGGVAGFMKKYRTFVRRHRALLSAIEQGAAGMTWFIEGENSEVWAEAASSAVGVVSTLNDHLVADESDDDDEGDARSSPNRGEIDSAYGNESDGGAAPDGGIGDRRRGSARDAKPPGIDAGAFVDYYSKLLSTTEETLRKTKGAE